MTEKEISKLVKRTLDECDGNIERATYALVKLIQSDNSLFRPFVRKVVACVAEKTASFQRDTSQ